MKKCVTDLIIELRVAEKIWETGQIGGIEVPLELLIKEGERLKALHNEIDERLKRPKKSFYALNIELEKLRGKLPQNNRA